jgi:hypothetical protein
MLIILTTWETEIGKIVVQGQPGQIVDETPPPFHFQNNQSKIDWGVVAQAIECLLFASIKT